ncbi:MAG: hypothetical protein ABJG78_12470 [Cyclobacteriaceae bacterium]
MEVIKGKGLTAVSSVLMAIAWFNQPLQEYSFQGFPFHDIPEWKLLAPLIFSWLLFLYRYLQGLGEMRTSVKLDFLKWLKRKNGWRNYDDLSPERIQSVTLEANLEYHIVDSWAYVYSDSGHVGERDLKYHTFEEVDPDYKGKWRIFKWRNRAYLNYFLPVGFSLLGFISLAVILFRMLS